MYQAEAGIVRRSGAFVAIAVTASVLVLQELDPAATAIKHLLLASYAVFHVGCAAVLLAPALARMLVGPCSSASSLAGAHATPLLTEATVRRAGALVALRAASVLVPLLVLFPAVEELKHSALAAYAIVLLGCTPRRTALFSPTHRGLSELARRTAEATGEILGAPWRAATELWWSSTAAGDSARATEPWSETAVAVRWTGALVALTAASALVLLLMPVHAALASKNINGVLALYAAFLLGCAAVLLSPAHPAAADIERGAAEAARNMNTFRARWAGFACICTALCAVSMGGDVGGEAAAAKAIVSSEEFVVLGLFLLLLVGVWMVSLSMVSGTGPPTLPVRLPLPPPPVTAQDNCTASLRSLTCENIGGNTNKKHPMISSLAC